MDKLVGRLAPAGNLAGSLAGRDTLTGDLAALKTFEEYGGAAEITPSTETQVLNTGGKHVAQNIVINPIPSNYGLITWNGLTLTVS